MLILLLSCSPSALGQQLEFKLSQAYLESIARFAAEYVEAARNEDHNRVLRLSCLQLGIATEYMRPETYPDESKRAEVSVLRDSSSDLLKELQRQGYCE